MQESFNPYSPPEARVLPAAELPDRDVVWRDGKELVVAVDAPLPERCVKCNCVTRGRAKRRTYFWYSPWINLLILVNFLICLVVLLIVRKRSRHEVSICETHARQRVLVIIGAWIGALLVAPFVGMAVDGIAGVVTGLLLFATSAILGLIYGRVMTPSKIDANYARYRGVSPAFLASLPLAPAYARRR